MDKLRLDYFLSLGLKLVEGDKYIFTEREYTITGGDNASAISEDEFYNEDRIITSFAPRKNTGEQPCGDDVPVLVTLLNKEVREAGGNNSCEGVGSYSTDLNSQYQVDTWQPDIEELIKMQSEHDACDKAQDSMINFGNKMLDKAIEIHEKENTMKKLTSIEIEWQEGDVCAVVELISNMVVVRYSYNRIPAEGDKYYTVKREVEHAKTVMDAVNYLRSELAAHGDGFAADMSIWEFNLCSEIDIPDSTIEQFNQCVTDLEATANNTFTCGPYNYQAYKDFHKDMEQDATEEVLHVLFDKTRSPWANLSGIVKAIQEKVSEKEAYQEIAAAYPSLNGLTYNTNAMKEFMDSQIATVALALGQKELREKGGPLPASISYKVSDYPARQEMASSEEAAKNFGAVIDKVIFGAIADEPTIKPIEWKNGDECVYNGGVCYFIGMQPMKDANLVGDCVVQHNGGCPLWPFVSELSKPDTRTDEQKLIEEIAHCIDTNYGASSEFIAKDIVDQFIKELN
jgi:hypothetical protein